MLKTAVGIGTAALVAVASALAFSPRTPPPLAPNSVGAEKTHFNALTIAGKRLPRTKVSWQSDNRLRFALKGIFPEEIDAMCRGVGLKLVGLKRLRVGRISMAKLDEGQWRYLMPWERF